MGSGGISDTGGGCYYQNRRAADVFIGIAALDILLGAAAGLWFGVLAAAVQTLVCGFIFRRQIWDKLIEWAYKKR